VLLCFAVAQGKGEMGHFTNFFRFLVSEQLQPHFYS